MKAAAPIFALLLCSLPLANAASDGEPAEITFSEHIAPIVFENCANCHRPGEVAPFSLTDYESVKRRAKTIQRVVSDRYMPPWHVDEGWGEYRGTMRLSDEQVDLLDRWVTAGAPEGDPARTPPLPDFPEGWHLGEPDLVVEMAEPFEVHAEGNDIYRFFALPLNLSEDRWVSAVEVRPSARSVVHHALFFLDQSGKARELDGKDGAPGFKNRGFQSSGSLGGWAVGGTPLDLGEGYGLPLAKGSDLVLQTHFHPSGKVEHERTKIGIYFAGGPPEKQLIEFQIPPKYGAGVGLNAGPGETDYEIRDHLIVPEDLDLITAWGHAHQICKSIQAEATLPDGTKKKLFRIGDWQFNWQGQYAYAEPVRLPKGTRIDTVITYDNSADNTANPNSPPRRIFWGEQSTDEMGSVIFQCVPADKAKHGPLASGLRAQAGESMKRFAEPRRDAVRRFLVLKLDADGDDRVTLEETPEQHLPAFKRLDDNADGVVTVDEVDANGGFLDQAAKKR